MDWILGNLLHFGVVLDSGKYIWILGSILDSGDCFGMLGGAFYSGKCSVIYRRHFGFLC